MRIVVPPFLCKFYVTQFWGRIVMQSLLRKAFIGDTRFSQFWGHAIIINHLNYLEHNYS